jgi:hypothetical protein
MPGLAACQLLVKILPATLVTVSFKNIPRQFLTGQVTVSVILRSVSSVFDPARSFVLVLDGGYVKWNNFEEDAYGTSH